MAVTQEDLENFAGLIGEEFALVQQKEREEVERQFELFRRALEIQANRIAALEEASVATPKRSSAAPAEKVTASLLQGRAS